mgnify:CR=1 FL=1
MRKMLDLSPNVSVKPRKLSEIKFVILHYTGMQSQIETLKRLKNPKAKVSCHYLINRGGKITQIAKDNRVAWHAGKSKWKNFKNLNKNSIGIELENKGHDFGYQNFTKPQIRKLIGLCKNLKKKYKIKKDNFLGHSDIAPLRKKDPGKRFPWKKLSNYNFGCWYKLDKKDEEITDRNKLYVNFFKNLHKIGYRYFKIYKRKKTDKLIVKAFQRRYHPSSVSGKIDQKTLKISYFLSNQKIS